MKRALWMLLCGGVWVWGAPRNGAPKPQFQTSDRCLACHNGLTTPSGEDVSIGFEWRASIMANSSRDPYWQASVRRETLDYPAARAEIEDECAICHMPITRYEAMLDGRKGRIFVHLPFAAVDSDDARKAEDGVSCSVCHQIGKERLGTPASFTGGFVVDAPDAENNRPEYGPFDVDKGHARIMQSSTEGFRPTMDDHIRQSEVCATCHTLYTHALGGGGEVLGRFPEQVPYHEWLHSEYKGRQSCQDCHMPAIREETPITRVFGTPRAGARRHSFIGANFFMQRMLNRFRDELSVTALPQELAAGADATLRFLQLEAARVSIGNVTAAGGRLEADVTVENLAGHKLPTAYPSRRAWLHVTVRGADGKPVFESGAVNPDGSIRGNDNDADPARFEPHYTEIRDAGQVQIYEPILGNVRGEVTTGLLTAVNYLKDNRLLPLGFDKATAHKDWAVHGGASEDPDFTGGKDTVHYSVPLNGTQGPFKVEAELWYQPIGFRWANNLKSYRHADEPRRFTEYYDAMGPATATVLARAGRESGR